MMSRGMVLVYDDVARNGAGVWFAGGGVCACPWCGACDVVGGGGGGRVPGGCDVFVAVAVGMSKRFGGKLVGLSVVYRWRCLTELKPLEWKVEVCLVEGGELKMLVRWWLLCGRPALKVLWRQVIVGQWAQQREAVMLL